MLLSSYYKMIYVEPVSQNYAVKKDNKIIWLLLVRVPYIFWFLSISEIPFPVSREMDLFKTELFVSKGSK